MTQGNNQAVPRKRVVTVTGAYEWRNYTVHDLIQHRGKGQLVQVMAFTPQEAAAAQEADLDMVKTSAGTHSGPGRQQH